MPKDSKYPLSWIRQFRFQIKTTTTQRIMPFRAFLVFFSFNWTFFEDTLTLILFWFVFVWDFGLFFGLFLLFFIEDTNKFIRFSWVTHRIFALSRTWKCQIKHLFYFIGEMYQYTLRTTDCHQKFRRKRDNFKQNKKKISRKYALVVAHFSFVFRFSFYWLHIQRLHQQQQRLVWDGKSKLKIT